MLTSKFAINNAIDQRTSRKALIQSNGAELLNMEILETLIVRHCDALGDSGLIF